MPYRVIEKWKVKSLTDVPKEPEVSESILAKIPGCLRRILQSSSGKHKHKKKAILISSHSLGNRFIIQHWGIRPSQRKRYHALFSTIRNECYNIFQHYLERGSIIWKADGNRYVFGIYKFEEERGNLILGFRKLGPNEEYKLLYKA
jgi:hypothetical protein